MDSSPPAVRLVRLLCWGLDAWLRPFKGKSPKTKECLSLTIVRVCPHAFRTLSKVKNCVYWACLVSQRSLPTFSFLSFSFLNLIFMAFLPGRLYPPPFFFLIEKESLREIGGLRKARTYIRFLTWVFPGPLCNMFYVVVPYTRCPDNSNPLSVKNKPKLKSSLYMWCQVHFPRKPATFKTGATKPWHSQASRLHFWNHWPQKEEENF